MIWIHQEQLFLGVLIKSCSENIQQIYKRAPTTKFGFKKVALQFYWNQTSAWVFSCKFAAYFQNTFSWEHLWMAVSYSWIWRSNQNIWKYAKRSIICKFAGLGLKLYYKTAPSQVFHKDKCYGLHNVFEFAEQLLFGTISYLTYLHKRKTAAQQTITCSRSTIQKLDKLWNVYKVYNKVTGASSIDAILVSLLLTLNVFHTSF